jgi:hypothetical protein
MLQWGRLVALWLCYFQNLGFSMSLTMISSNIAGYTKKQLSAAVVFIGFCIGNAVGPQTFINSEARKYSLLLDITCHSVWVKGTLTHCSDLHYSISSNVDRIQHKASYVCVIICAYVDVQFEEGSRAGWNTD